MPDGAAHTRKPFALGRLLRHPCRFSELSHSIGIPHYLPLRPRHSGRSKKKKPSRFGSLLCAQGIPGEGENQS